MKALLKEKYGDQVIIDYIDVDDDPEIDNYPDIIKMIEDKSAPLPIVTMNDKLVYAGAISYPLIVSELTKDGIIAIK